MSTNRTVRYYLNKTVKDLLLDPSARNMLGSSSGGGSVTSVFGRAGDIIAATNDYTFAQIGSKPTTVAGYGITDAITASSTTTFTNKSGNISQWTNNSGYITANQSITLSGDISGTGTTAITTVIGASKVTNTMLAGSIASSKLVGTDIITIGTITTGTWNGTAIGDTYISSATTWNAKLTDPLTTNGDIVARVGGVSTRLAKGSDNTFLTSRSGTLAYSALALTDLPAQAVGTILGNNTTASTTPIAIIAPVVIIGTTTVTNQANATIDLTNYYTVYDIIEIYLYAVTPATDNTELQMLVSSDGSTFANSAGNYKWGLMAHTTQAPSTSPVGRGNESEAYIGLGTAVGNTSTKSSNYKITIYNAGGSSYNPTYETQGRYINNGGFLISMQGAGVRLNAQVTRATRFLMSSGNITCTYKVIGIKQ